MWGGGDLLAELKKTREGRHTPDLPKNVAGANGEEEVCSKFREVYNDLYNSADTTQEMIDIKAGVEDNVDHQGLNKVMKISLQSVKVAAQMMNSQK